jgi:hypothetical protein
MIKYTCDDLPKLKTKKISKDKSLSLRFPLTKAILGVFLMEHPRVTQIHVELEAAYTSLIHWISFYCDLGIGTNNMEELRASFLLLALTKRQGIV